ncbi:AAA family ATPase [Arenibacter sp. F20364]|uniref:AAA family ATPase n=1 Tax=Arenibacter sp. F20364 TaxID=2926415 RepID=UPI001FF3BB4C|nr:AAA family ATPase [Arenibacter sp. F20364]MCK0190451.1 ATP-binding protein [Arenibacter sp. F20364]
MRLAAIFIPNGVLKYIFGEEHTGITLNLGGRNIYKFEEHNDKLMLIEKKPNPHYIEKFWGENLYLVSAIVGANGTGKSSILNVFRYNSFCFYVYEFTNKDEYKIVRDTKAINDIIYYSPFLNIENYNYINSNFKDISKYALMVEDAEYENIELSAQLELHNSENLKRWIKFRQIKNIESYLTNIYLPVFDKIIVKINYLVPKVNDTPYKFRPFFQRFENLKKIEEEKKFQVLRSSYPNFNIKNRPRLFGHSIKLELEILQRVINKVQNILENSGNDYLDRGFIKNKIDVDNPVFTEIKSLKEAFYWFIDNAYISLAKDSGNILLPVTEIKNLIEVLLSHIPGSDNEIKNFTEFEVTFEDSLEIVNAYEKFIIAFKEHFTLDRKILLTFRPNKNLSSGEKGMYNLFATLYDYQFKIDQGILEDFNSYTKRDHHNNNNLILLDEADIGFHPLWRRRFIYSMLPLFNLIFPNKKLQIVFTTHDPLTLSDIPNRNIVYLKKNEMNETSVLENHKQKSFGANVHDLLADSFFLQDGFMGEFAKNKIQEVLNGLNYEMLRLELTELKEKKSGDYSELTKAKEKEFDQLKAIVIVKDWSYYKSIITIVDEPILKFKMMEMFNEAFPKIIDKNEALANAKKILGDAGLSLDDLIDDIV